MSTENKNLTPKEKAQIISAIILEYEEVKQEMPNDLFVSEYAELHNSLLAKIYDRYFKEEK